MKLAYKISAVCTVVLAVLMMLSFSSLAAFKPSEPADFKAAAAAADKVSLSWKKSTGADYYKIYVKQNGKWKSLKNSTSTKCEISGLTASETYTFAVKSVNKENGRNYLSDGYATVKVKTKSLAATKLTAVAGADYVTLSWEKVPGASGYYVCRKVDGEWLRVKKLGADTLSCEIGKLKSGTTHQFFVRAFAETQTKTVSGPKSNTVKPKTLKANKVKLKVSASNTSSVTLSWSRAADASGYRVYRYVDGKWKTVKTINSRDTLKTVISSLKSDSKYIFSVRAFKNTSAGKLWFVAADEVVATTDPVAKNLKLTRTKNLSKLLSGQSFTLCYNTETSKYGNIPVRIYKNGKNYRLDSKAEEISYTLLNTAGADYVLLSDKKLYAEVPSLLEGATDISEAVASLLPESDWQGKVALAEFGGKKVVCETFTDILKTKSVRYYYRAGELVGIEQYNSAGKIVEKATVTRISDTAAASLFKIPGSYKEML